MQTQPASDDTKQGTFRDKGWKAQVMSSHCHAPHYKSGQRWQTVIAGLKTWMEFGHRIHSCLKSQFASCRHWGDSFLCGLKSEASEIIFLKNDLKSPVSCRNSWLQAAAPSFHGWGLDRCNTPAYSLQQLPTPDDTLSLERRCMGESRSKADRMASNWDSQIQYSTKQNGVIGVIVTSTWSSGWCQLY